MMAWENLAENSGKWASLRPTNHIHLTGHAFAWKVGRIRYRRADTTEVTHYGFTWLLPAVALTMCNCPIPVIKLWLSLVPWKFGVQFGIAFLPPTLRGRPVRVELYLLTPTQDYLFPSTPKRYSPMRPRATTNATMEIHRSASDAPVPLHSHVSTYRSVTYWHLCSLRL